MAPASSKTSQIRSPTAVIPHRVYSASLSLSETRTGTEFYHLFLPKSALLYLRLPQKEDLKRAKVSYQPESSLFRKRWS